MAAPIHHLESSLKHGGSESVSVPFHEQWEEDDRILIDIETEMALHSHMESKQDKFSQRIPRFLLAGRTLGPLSVLLLLAFYALLSPLLSPAIHEYIYHILH